MNIQKIATAPSFKGIVMMEVPNKFIRYFDNGNEVQNIKDKGNLLLGSTLKSEKTLGKPLFQVCGDNTLFYVDSDRVESVYAGSTSLSSPDGKQVIVIKHPQDIETQKYVATMVNLAKQGVGTNISLVA